MIPEENDDRWVLADRELDLSQRGLIMGIVNVTPDSFSDGGDFFVPARAIEHGLSLVEEGADIVDIGGESTRPNAAEVDVAEELRRVLPVISGLRANTDALISIDTSKAEVARQAVDAGADIINDVAGFRGPGMVEVAAGCGAGLVAMHMLGNPRTMQANPVYRDVVQEVRDFFLNRFTMLTNAGVDPNRLVFDPGIGFGKTVDQNLQLLANLQKLRARGRPLLIGVSRKSFISHILGEPSIAARSWPTVALTAMVREAGAGVVRVHDVPANLDAMRMAEAIMGAG